MSMMRETVLNLSVECLVFVPCTGGSPPVLVTDSKSELLVSSLSLVVERMFVACAPRWLLFSSENKMGLLWRAECLGPCSVSLALKQPNDCSSLATRQEACQAPVVACHVVASIDRAAQHRAESACHSNSQMMTCDTACTLPHIMQPG
jgi:hypothetical protein